ncbi:MAG: acetyl-CoA carboxylase, carboxyltransferase subunit beta [Proteobacteria bacterium]|nr:acetyl-CoA carboxylase, carboxyltransferase subunit beta [Pseudomonadota bacterium]
MNWLSSILPGIKKKKPDRGSVPEGVWEQCKQCATTVYTPEKEKNLWICPHCNYHERINAPRRATILFDETPTVQEFASEVRSYDFLKFSDGKTYQERLEKSQAGDSRREAIRTYYGTVNEVPLVAAIFDFTFMGGSMGSVVGERFVRGVEEAITRNVPFVSFTASGGARMQEGVTALFQMAKTTAALSRLAEKKLPYISILTDPTTGGVAASFAMIADVVIAEPKALIGFAGPRVIQETVREQLPEGFQRSEFLLKHGAVDMIWERRELRNKLSELLTLLTANPGQ